MLLRAIRRAARHLGALRLGLERAAWRSGPALAAAGLVSALLACGGRSSLRDGGGVIDGGLVAGGSGAGAAGQGGATTGTTGSGAAGGSLDDVVAACVIAATCASDTFSQPPFRASSCVDSFARLGWHFGGPGSLPDPALAKRLLACATSGDCASFRECFGGDWIGLTRCREGGSCAGDVMTSYGESLSFDCAAIGAGCMDLWSGAIRACCNAEPCLAPTEATCDGTLGSYCGPWGEHLVFDCGASGRACVPGVETPYELCAGSGATCDVMNTPTTCQGSVATHCSGGRLATLDCLAIPYRSRCADGAAAWEPACRPRGDECDPLDVHLGCQGEALEVCVDGFITPVSCAALGLGGCTANLGEYDKYVAHCGP